MKAHFSSLFLCILIQQAFGQVDFLWGNQLPERWNGDWSEELRTAAEKSGFTYTATNQDLLNFFALMHEKSEYVNVFSMFTSDHGRDCPVMVLSNPRVRNARQARESGKPVIYLQGGIHPAEPQGKEALQMVIRDILFGEKSYLLDELIILVAPNYNVDGNEARVVNTRKINPRLEGTRHNAKNLDVNRDAIKLETRNMQGAVENIYRTWDPILLFDMHRMGRTQHGYGIGQAGSNVVTAHPEPRDYVNYTMFPEIIKLAKELGNIQVGFHAGLNDSWPPTEFDHDRAYWSTEGKFMASGYGLRNRMAVIVENPGEETYEKGIYVHYIYTLALLEYCHKNGQEMLGLCKKADLEVVQTIQDQAASGKLENAVSGKYVSEGKQSIYAYRERKIEQVPGSSMIHRVFDEPPVLVENVELITKPVAAKTAKVPRGYILPAELKYLVDILEKHGVEVNQLDQQITISKGEQYEYTNIYYKTMGFANYQMTTLDGAFKAISNVSVEPGAFHIDLAQPLAYLVFYALEPEVRDGFMGWNMMDDLLKEKLTNNEVASYPILKYFTLDK